ncbi:related to multidrug resistance protein [Serendipita indica DSM 11827]|uniref:Related to multidrug resistance protein n=1 Tax=Serendipita indica (strain DSM 11827) TaxID=1109443 RepID=G4TLG5_SERID|nr:related to multidrug resistance protein [Serendipita indica DSM 11827]
MKEYDPVHPSVIVSPTWRKWVLVVLSLMAIAELSAEVLGQLLSFADVGVVTEKMKLYGKIVSTACWVYTTMRISFRPLRAAPVGNILFYGIELINRLVNISDGVILRVPFPQLLPLLYQAAIASIALYISGTIPLSPVLPSTTVSSPTELPSSRVSSPEDSVSFWNWVVFSFPSLYYPISMVRRLEMSDVWKLSPRFLHANLFQKYLSSQSTRPRSLIWFLVCANSADIILDITLEMYKAVAGFLPPYALKQLLGILSSTEDDPNAWGSKYVQAHFWALVTFVAHLSFAQCDLAQGWCTRRCYERTRGIIFCTLHYKALRRRVVGGAGPAPKQDSEQKDEKTATIEQERSADLGKVVNLMQGDAYAVAQRFWELSPLFGAPVRIGVALWFLYDLLGPSAFAGVLVILGAYLINWPLIKWNLYITRHSWRIPQTNGMGGRMGAKSREAELAWRVQENICSAILAFIWTWIPSATALASFIAYTLISKRPLTVSVAFTALGVFGQLQSSMTALPGHIFAMFHAYISMQRIDSFLSESEVPDWASSFKRSTTPFFTEHSSERIGYEQATLEWHRADDNLTSGVGSPIEVTPDEDRHLHLDEGQPITAPEIDHPVPTSEPIRGSSSSVVTTPTSVQRFALRDLNIQLPVGKLTLVTGITGSGKTAFLTGLLGEMQLLRGKVHLDKSNHKIAYCAQSPWLEHATIRENIVYGSVMGYDEGRYDAVVMACALEKDLEILPAGDMTEIGEKGVSLSGGQRARIALARAIYSPARTILLDDPLAAVDMHTARHLTQHCFASSLMQGRTVILVTHHVSLCIPLADYLVEISSGRIVKQGRVEDLRKSGELDEVLSQDTSQEAGSVLEQASNNLNEADVILESSGSATPTANESPKSKPKWRLSTAEAGKLVDEEARAEGRVSWRTYKTYIKAAGYWSWALTFALMLLIRGINILNQFYLSKWGEAYNRRVNNSSFSPMLVQKSHTFQPVKISTMPIIDDLPPPDQNVRPWLFIYFCISLVGAFTVLGYISLGYYASLQASRLLFQRMLTRLSRAPSRFFDVTPIGRILNRFVADIGAVDGAVNNSARSALGGALSFISSFSVIVFVVPAFAPVAIFIAWLYIRLAPPYIRTSRDLRRLESISLSPAFAGFDELLHGLVHVRAFGVEQRYQDRFYSRVDTFQAFDHSYWLVAFWLRWRYDCLGSVVVYLTTLFALGAKVSTGFAAVVILNAGAFAEASRQLVKVLAQVELDFNSIERIGEYLEVHQEAPAIIEKARPPAYWPSSTSGIVVEDLWIRYSPTSPDVIRGLSFQIAPGEKIGVVGRTGSGKTTLCAAFLRVIEAHRGKIIIDGIDISKIGLEDLRTKLTIVSQDVALFEGSVRSNLDPFEEHSDQECWDVLRRCHLVEDADQANSTTRRRAVFASLDAPISISGGSLSAGQRQLVALARAMLRRSQVVLTDEATSAIDLELDDQIQQTIREEMGSATVITIAHRLRTVIEYDRILVLDHGEIVEFDSPATLLRNPDGAFSRLCRGSADWEVLKQLVKGT